MRQFSFDYSSTGGIAANQLNQHATQATEALAAVRAARQQGYQTPYTSVNLPFDQQMRAEIADQIAQKQKLNPQAIVVLGIGGSLLGFQAVQQALGQSSLQVHGIDTVDSDLVAAALAQVEPLLKAGKTVLLNVVTKSGKTTETIANFAVFLEVFKRHRPKDYAQMVVVTTDAGSPLEAIARQEGFAVLPVPAQVGGRYSVLSAVGLFPLGLLGVDVEQLCAGAAAMVEQCVSDSVSENPALAGAALLAGHYQQGIKIHDLFVFSTRLQAFGMWYRQLLAESIGKAELTDGTRKPVGITPTVSVGSSDLHSQAQLYLNGAVERFTTFVRTHPATQITIPTSNQFDACVPHISGKSLSQVMDAIFAGVTQAYAQAGLPFTTITLPQLDAHALGQLLQLHMLQTIYLGALLRVNPFDQPQVELYKKETGKVLAGG